MTIEFESFDTVYATMQLHRQPRVLLTDRTSVFRLRRQPMVDMEVSTTDFSVMSVRHPQPRVRLTDRNDVFLLHRKKHITIGDGGPVPSASVFVLNRPQRHISMSIKVTDFSITDVHRQPRVLLTDASARFVLHRQPHVFIYDGVPDTARTAYLIQQPVLLSKMVFGLTCKSSSQIVLGDDHLVRQITWVLHSMIRLDDKSNRMLELLRRLEDRIGLSDLVEHVFAATMASSVALGDSVAASEIRLMALIDHITMVGGASSTQEATRAIAIMLALHDAAAKPVIGTMLSSMVLTGELSNEIEAYAHALDQIRLAATTGGTLLLTATLHDSVLLGDGTNRLLEITRAIKESIAVCATLSIAGEGYTAWVMGMDSKAVWTYDDYPFNSFATVGGKRLAAGPDGISELGGEDDNGSAIAWAIQTGMTNLGTMFKKRLDCAYIGYTSDGQVGLSTIATDPADGARVQYNFVLEKAVNAKDETTPNRIKLGRGIEAVYFSFRLAGTGPFSLSNARILKLNTSRRV